MNEVMENIDFMVIYTAEYSGDWSPGTSITAPYKGFVSSSIINMKKNINYVGLNLCSIYFTKQN